jgi:type II secretory pathway component PulF
MQYGIEQTQRAWSLRLQIWIAFAYPLFLLSFAGMVCAFIVLAVVPQFGPIFNNFGTPLPATTVFLIQVSTGLVRLGWVPFATAGSICIGCWAGFLFLGASRWGQRWSTSIPLFGSVFQMAALSDFCQILAILSESGLPFSRAIVFAGRASDDRWLRRKCLLLADDLERGSTPEQAAKIAHLPPTLLHAFRHASSDQTFFAALRGMADIFAARCSVNARVTNTLVEPLAVTIVMLFAGFTTIAMLLPLVRLLNMMT